MVHVAIRITYSEFPKIFKTMCRIIEIVLLLIFAMVHLISGISRKLHLTNPKISKALKSESKVRKGYLLS